MNNHFSLALIAAAASTLLLVGCHRAPVGEAAPDAQAASAGEKDTAGAKDPADAGAAGGGVTLKPAQVETMGIETAPAQATDSAPEVQGFGVVLPHETIATAVAEVRTAIAAERQSHAALERTRRLAGTPGAMPAEAQETAERQAIADQAALELARRKLSSSFGLNPPWKSSDNSAELRSLAGGESKLVHVTFPLGLLGDTDPDSIRLTRIGGAQGGQSWQSKIVWHAPADATVPGRSYFAILKRPELGEGDHLLAWTPVGDTEKGVTVPASAAVISNGQFYCYVEGKAGTFVRTAFDPSRPTTDGYFVKDGISPGDRIVTRAAGLLLAREMQPRKQPE